MSTGTSARITVTDSFLLHIVYYSLPVLLRL